MSRAFFWRLPRRSRGNQLRPWVAVAAAAAALPLSSAGCEVDVASICDAFCDCQGCTDAEFKECVTSSESSYNTAEGAGCGEEADAYLSCVQGELRCFEDSVELGEECDAEYDDLITCSGTGIGFGGCELGVEQLAECLGINPEDLGECTPDIECNLICISRATCEEIQNGSQELNDCFSSCPPIEPGGGGTGGVGGGSSGAGGAGGGPPPPQDPPKPD
jgi:hypothetical protein